LTNKNCLKNVKTIFRSYQKCRTRQLRYNLLPATNLSKMFRPPSSNHSLRVTIRGNTVKLLTKKEYDLLLIAYNKKENDTIKKSESMEVILERSKQERWAGAAFENCPNPSSLPIPSFISFENSTDL